MRLRLDKGGMGKSPKTSIFVGNVGLGSRASRATNQVGRHQSTQISVYGSEKTCHSFAAPFQPIYDRRVGAGYLRPMGLLTDGARHKLVVRLGTKTQVLPHFVAHIGR